MKIFKHLALILILLFGFQSLAQDDKVNQSKRFQSIDTDGNEIVTISELITYHKGKTNKKGETIDAELMFYGLDKDNNSIITLEEYVKGVDWKAARQHKVIKRRGTVSSNNLDAISKDYSTKLVNKFYKIDSDKNKSLSLKEMLDFHQGKTNSKGEPIKAYLLFYGLDSNIDDELTFEEYVQKVDWKAARERKESAEQRIEARRLAMRTPKEKRKAKRQKKKGIVPEIPKPETPMPEKAKPKTKNSNTILSSMEDIKIDKFIEADTNFDKEISLEEMVYSLKDKKNKKGEPIESELMFYGLDTDDNGKITIEEFIKKVNWKAAKQKMKAKER